MEEKLALKDEELDNVYSQYQSQLSKLEEKSKDFDNILREKDDMISQVQEQLEQGKTRKKKKYAPVEEVEEVEEFEEFNPEEYDYSQQDNFLDEQQEFEENPFAEEQPAFDASEDFNYLADENAVEQFEDSLIQKEEPINEEFSFDYKDKDEEEPADTGLTFDYKNKEEEKPK